MMSTMPAIHRQGREYFTSFIAFSFRFQKSKLFSQLFPSFDFKLLNRIMQVRSQGGRSGGPPPRPQESVVFG